MDSPPENSPSLPSGVDADDHHNTLLKPKKHAGRPKGSKNKPKPQPLIITNNVSWKADDIDVINVPSSVDLIGWLCQYSLSIRHPFGCSQPSLFVPGPVPVMSLSGSITTDVTSSSSSHSLVICVPGCQGQIVYGLIGGSVIATGTVTIVIVVEDNKTNRV
ncbi:AT-hook motif nuclear-localized protein 28-like [Senna tora]|uniref:AT-hook motif nuclear-localized protein 28-like n=1 Tax=Senna tora TaxID=362788 RepID=A0A834T5Y4_9FABA|nr:AT-hook motif nuclear-localized protein 28-like [Senna tora]